MERKNRVYSVKEISNYIRNMFDQDFLLNRVSVKGEVSNAKDHPAGHLYFTLKDEKAQISVVMFSSNRLKGLKCRLRDGMQAVVTGEISVYENGGRYQLYAREITDDGEGELYRRFIELRDRLREMGMFDAAYKKPIPKYAKTVGIVTSESGAALRDIVSISSRRNPYVQLILSPALVQGSYAPESIAEAIGKLDRLHPDVMIVGRGGGSMEDLFCFNDERVARAIFDADTPVISAVGHETDFTIADFTADLRAPTPSAAAELAVFDFHAAEQELGGYGDALYRAVSLRTDRLSASLQSLENALKASHPAVRVREHMLRLLEAGNRLSAAENRILTSYRHRTALLSGRIADLSPASKLKGGYLYAEIGGELLRSVLQVQPGDVLDLTLPDGTIRAEVLEKRKSDQEGGI